MTCVNENYEKVLQAINEKVKELGWNEWKRTRKTIWIII
jgi:hypothetical protein